MGYRSEIAIKVHGEEAKMLAFKNAYDAGRAELPEEHRAYIDEMNRADDRNGFDDGIFTFHAEEIKWYSSLVVDFYNGLLELVDELELNSEFVRIGDDDDDVEIVYQGEHEYILNVVRTIDGI